VEQEVGGSSPPNCTTEIVIKSQKFTAGYKRPGKHRVSDPVLPPPICGLFLNLTGLASGLPIFTPVQRMDVRATLFLWKARN
jgi:hypothetical protein